jgi:hypothetical protein
VHSELEIVRARQLMGQYIILEDTLIAGVEKFEGMILRPSDKAKLAGFIEELDKLTKQYQAEWEDDYWESYNLQRGVFTEISAPGSPQQRRNRLSLKLESFRQFELGDYAKASTFDPSFLSSEVERPKSYISPPVNTTLSVVDQQRAPANSEVSVREAAVDTSPPRAGLVTPKAAPITPPAAPVAPKTVPVASKAVPVTPQAVPVTHLVDQDSSVVVRKENMNKSTTKESTESGPSCCAKCNVM